MQRDRERLPAAGCRLPAGRAEDPVGAEVLAAPGAADPGWSGGVVSIGSSCARPVLDVFMI